MNIVLIILLQMLVIVERTIKSGKTDDEVNSKINFLLVCEYKLKYLCLYKNASTIRPGKGNNHKVPNTYIGLNL